jgi:hypothetical protein
VLIEFLNEPIERRLWRISEDDHPGLESLTRQAGDKLDQLPLVPADIE